MHLLVLNPGSSTLKYRLVEIDATRITPITSGNLEELSGERIAQAAGEALRRCQGHPIDAVGCRIVHGGEQFAEPVRLTPAILGAIRDLGRLAPLHNYFAAEVLGALTTHLPGVPAVVVFDTAFHRTIPDVASLYALPLKFAQARGLRRYGFHGTSHRYIASQVPVPRLISCHLGNGASITAIRDGHSVDTSMGFTPLEGLMMGTRTGDLDPALVLHLQRAEGLSLEQIDRLLNKESGLLGVGGAADLRKLESSGEPRAELAMAMFAYRVRKYIGAYASVLEGVDAIAMTAGIGEHSVAMRERILRPLTWLGVHLDAAANASRRPGNQRISTPDSPVQAWIIPTDEESLIARATHDLLSADHPTR